MNRFCIVLLPCAAAAGVFGSSSVAPETTNNPNEVGKTYALYPKDLVMETVSDWTVGRYVTPTGTVLRRFARNFLTWTKILVNNDERCRGLVVMKGDVRFEDFPIVKGLEEGIQDLLNLLIVRANRNNVGDVLFRSSLEQAKVGLKEFISNRGALEFKKWDDLVYNHLLTLFSKQGLEFFGIWWKKDLLDVYRQIHGVVNAARQMIALRESDENTQSDETQTE